ncbi:hypothetical protein [Pedobacter nyackensis]|uniref:hypothetical protein n=1 Tax=Pedobacter nyackensis TaxID=475255 RepID=UPI00293067F4|nr:hypothetical protein [Pedobacter nyackensis]
MKSFIKISLVAALLFNAVGSYASEGDLSFKLKRVNEKSVTFFINETQPTEVFIYDAADVLIYNQKINALKGSTKTFNFDSLPDGNYSFKLNTDSKSVEYKIELKDGQALVSNPLVEELFKPVFRKVNDIITLNFENAPAGPVEIEILDRHNDAIYNKVFEADASFVKKFDVGRVGRNELTFIIRSANQVFTKTVQM